MELDFSVSDISSLFAVLVSIVSLFIASNQARSTKGEESADKMREAARKVVARLERWQSLRARYFEEIQPLLVDVDAHLVGGQDKITVRDTLWKSLVTAQSLSSERIENEQIEMAYSDLYGYNPKVQELFSITVQQLRILDEAIHAYGLHMSQHIVLYLGTAPRRLRSAQVGNALRLGFSRLALKHKAVSDDVLAVFRNEMMKLIEADASAISGKTVPITTANRTMLSTEVLVHDIEDFIDLDILREPVAPNFMCAFCYTASITPFLSNRQNVRSSRLLEELPQSMAGN